MLLTAWETLPSAIGAGDHANIYFGILVHFHWFILKQSEDHIPESIWCFCPVANFHSSTFLGDSVQVLAKEGHFLFYRMSLVLWSSTWRETLLLATRWDHITHGDLYNLCNNLIAWPHRPINVHKLQPASIALGCSYEQVPRKEIKCGWTGKSKIYGSGFYNPRSQMSPPSSPSLLPPRG